tara:strand:+ start:12197 stop:13213 length:1017 start_codon:yes stop_codon:yes gene_type:complete
MASGLVTAVSYLCTVIGLGFTFAYLCTFYLTPYNQLYLVGESGTDDSDFSYTLAIVECVVSGCTFIVGVLAFAAVQKPPPRVVLVALVFFGVSGLLEGTFGTLRAFNLGLIGTNIDHTCSDTGVFTGCPTTRFEAKHKQTILYTSPNGGDCQFWFWDSMKRRGSTNACQGAYSSAKCSYNIETFMDWSSPTSYGWRDDPSELSNLTPDTGVLTTIKKTHNMAELEYIQSNTTGAVITPFTTQPSLAYCWYWGCNSVCNSHRYLINRLWLVFSVVLCLLHATNVIMVGVLWRQQQRPAPKRAPPLVSETSELGVSSPFVVPDFGRRRRQLQQNPSVLQF